MKTNERTRRPVTKSYQGYRSPSGRCKVTVSDSNRWREPLPLRLDLRNHSPTGFEWGYGGSGPAQLALALLADCLGDAETALRFYQEFKQEVVTGLGTSWTLIEQEIRQFVESRRNGT